MGREKVSREKTNTRSGHSFVFVEQVQSAKYLGLTITDNLDWGQHVSEISCKATKTMGFLRCNLALAPRHTKEHTKHWFDLSSSMQHLFGIPITNFRFKR